MHDHDLYLQRELNRQLNVITKSNDDSEENFSIKLEDENASDQFLSLQDMVLESIPGGKTKSITISDDSSKIAEIDLSALNSFKTEIEHLEKRIERLNQVHDAIDKIDSLHKTYTQARSTYDEKLEKVENLINQKFGIVDNTLNKQKGTESKIKPYVFKGFNTRYGEDIRQYFKKHYSKLFQGKKVKTPVEQKSMNNALYTKLKIKENLLKEFKNARATSNPDQLAEEMLISLIRPIKAVSNALHQYSSEKKQEIDSTRKGTTPLAKNTKSNIEVINGGKTYNFGGYSKDYSKISLIGEGGKELEMLNNTGISLKLKKAPKLNPIQQDLLDKGKSLLITDDAFPYKISKNNEGYLELKTISTKDFSAGNQKGQKISKSVKQSI